MNSDYIKKPTLNTSINLLSFSIFFILAGLLLVPKTSNYHTIYYISTIAPTLIILTIKPNSIPINNILILLIAFATWSTLSILWSDTSENISTPIKRSIYILCLFISFAIVHSENKNKLLKIFIFSGSTIALVASFDLYTSHIFNQHDDRFIGPGALKNPLLSSHIFGFFTALFFTLSITIKNNKVKSIYFIFALILLSTVIATGSRTPLLALAAAAIWIIILLKNRTSVYIILFSTITLLLILVFNPEAILNRGLSYRPELWNSAIDKILLKPFIGYGFESSLEFHVESLNKFFKEPHNIHLSILYFTGLIGFTLWCAMHIYALWTCWKNRKDTLFIIASTLLVYGIMAGMTEGGGLLPRPKEHWFLTWIPLAFIAALIPTKKPILDDKDHISLQN